MSTYQTLLKQATDARTQAQARLDELRIAVANLRNNLVAQMQAPEGSVTIAQSKPDGTLKPVNPHALTYTEENTVRFQIQVRLDGARGLVAKLTVPAAITRTDVSIAVTIEDSEPHAYQAGTNTAEIKLIVDSLARQADEVGV